MCESENQLVIECQRAGVYDLYLTWRPLEGQEIDLTAGRPSHQDKPGRDIPSSSSGDILAASEQTVIPPSRRTADDSEKIKANSETKEPATRAIDTDKKDKVRKKGNKTKVAKVREGDEIQEERRRERINAKRAETGENETENKIRKQENPISEGGVPDRGPCRPLYTLEMYEVAPVADWVRMYHGAGTACRLRKLKPNLSHRIRVWNSAGVSKVRALRVQPSDVDRCNLQFIHTPVSSVSYDTWLTSSDVGRCTVSPHSPLPSRSPSSIAQYSWTAWSVLRQF